MAGTLRVSRNWALVDSSQRWPIKIDGAGVGSIGSRQTVELPVEPGHHVLGLGSNRHVKERSFEAADGQVVSFRCRAPLIWPVLLAALVKPDLWISLRQE
jgi:hypothetical protein